MSLSNTQSKFSIVLIRLMLAIVVLAASFAFMPQSAQAADETAAPAATKWSVKLGYSSITITGSGFVSQRTYYVRIKERVYDPYVRIGKAKSNKEGKINTTLSLPHEFRGKTTLRVCLKDTSNNKTYCVLAKRKP